MIIPCKDIATIMKQTLKERVSLLAQQGKLLKLVTFLIGDAPDQLSFVAIKKRLASELGIEFEFIPVRKSISQNDFLHMVKHEAHDASTNGVLIQLPLPGGFDTKAIYSVIPREKDIEGHRTDSRFIFPLALSILTGIKYMYLYPGATIDAHIVVDVSKDTPFFQKILAHTKIVVVGRGATGGKPIYDLLTKIGIRPTLVHSQTSHKKHAFKQADIIISATGKHVIHKKDLKNSVALLNVGLRKEEGKLKGDYDEQEIQDIASFYTQTPGGLGPLDVLYLYKNLIDTRT